MRPAGLVDWELEREEGGFTELPLTLEAVVEMVEEGVRAKSAVARDSEESVELVVC